MSSFNLAVEFEKILLLNVVLVAFPKRLLFVLPNKELLELSNNILVGFLGLSAFSVLKREFGCELANKLTFCSFEVIELVVKGLFFTF